MRKTKRIVALVLALTMVFCFMAMSASAATTEVQPRGTCPQCINGYVTTTTKMEKYYTNYTSTEIGYNECSYQTMPHVHYYVKYNVWVDCNNCSYNGVSYSYWRYFCPHSA